MNNTTNNKLFIELLGPSSSQNCPCHWGAHGFSHRRLWLLFFFVLRNIRIGEGIMGSVLLDEVPNRTDSEQGSSVCEYHTERGWKRLFSISCRF